MVLPVSTKRASPLFYSVPVPPDLDKEVRRRIELGGFRSLSDYVRTAIRAELDRAATDPLVHKRGSEEMDMQTEVDIAEYSLAASRKAAALLDLDDTGWLGEREVLERIGRVNGQVRDRISAMLARYADWRRFHGWVERTGKTGRLSAAEHDELVRLQQELDRTRAELTAALDARPPQK